MHDRRTRSKLPARTTSCRQESLSQNNRDNQDRQNRQNNKHQERKRGPDNTIAMADKSKNFPNPENMKTLKIYIMSGTLKEITQPENATSSLIDIQEKIVRGALKKTIKKKMKTTTKTRDSKNLGGQ